MPLIVRAFPLLAGKEEELMQFARDLSGRSAEAAEFYATYGVTRESWHLQKTATGSLVIGVTELTEVEPAASEYAASERPFDRWFKSQVHRLSGVDPDREPLGPPTEQIFDFCQGKS